MRETTWLFAISRLLNEALMMDDPGVGLFRSGDGLVCDIKSATLGSNLCVAKAGKDDSAGNETPKLTVGEVADALIDGHTCPSKAKLSQLSRSLNELIC